MVKSFPFIASVFSLLANAQQVEDQERITIIGHAPTYLTEQQSVVPLTDLDLFGASQVGSIADALSLSPQISLNGQGGLFQTVSIRGFSRWRVQTLVEGIPIHSERRAGNAAEFVAPDLLAGAHLLSGAASTQLGSGAIGGGIDLQLAASEDPMLSVSTNTQQAYRSLSLKGANNTDSHLVLWAGNIRRAGQGSDAEGEALLNQFEQVSGILRWASENHSVKDALLLMSLSEDVGKASSDLVTERLTLYPKNNHLLAKVDFDWHNARFYAHQADFDTRIVRTEQRTNLLSNQALGWGTEISNQFGLNDWQLHWRLALDARTGVKVAEKEIAPLGDLEFDRINLKARQFAYSLSVNTTRKIDATEVSAGFRTEFMSQKSDLGDVSGRDDVNVSGFVGAGTQWGGRWRSGVYISSGYRVPTLTERFFSGSTPRGQTLGDPYLETEKALNVQADVGYVTDNLTFSVSLFQQSIDHYIERISLSSTLQQYVNIGNAAISGASLQMNWRFAGGFYASVSGQVLSGEGDNGDPINDVSPDQYSATIGWRGSTQELWFGATHRRAHSRPGDSELATESVSYLRAGYQADLTPSLALQFHVNNLTDTLYPVSTDDRAPNALGRDVELSLSYIF